MAAARYRGGAAVCAMNPITQAGVTCCGAPRRRAPGADAQVKDDPYGGVVAQLGHRRMDLSLSALAERVLDRLAPEVDGLWS